MEGEKSKRSNLGVFLKVSLRQISNETSALAKKNYLIFSRNKYLSLMLIICPFFICLYLQRIQNTIEIYTTSLSDPYPEEVNISKIPKCFGQDCLSLAIGLTGGRNELSEYIVDHISHKSGLNKEKDVKIVTYTNSTSFIEYIQNHVNKTSVGMILCTNYAELPENNYLEKISCDETYGHLYIIMYNYTMISKNLFDTNLPDPIQAEVLAAKLAIDNAILSYECKKRGLKDVILEAVIQSFPQPPNRFLKGYDSVSMTGPFYFFIPPMFVFGLLISEIVKEKELKLRNGLSVIGVSATSFWLSWFLVAFFFSFMTTNSLILSGYMFQFSVFLRTPYLVMFALFMTYTLTMMVLGFFLSTMINSVRLAYTISYTFLLGGLVLQNFFMSQTLIKLFHLELLPDWVYWVRLGFTFYPPYSFSRIFCNIAIKAGSVPNYHTRMWEAGPGYFYSDFIQDRDGYLAGMYYRVPADYIGLLELIRNFFILCVLTWYFDHVLPGNRGRTSPPWFMFTRDYWGCSGPKLTPVVTNSEIELSSINKYSMKTPITGNNPSEITDGIRLEGLYKKYQGSKSTAVKPLHFSIEKDECLAIIGHNGAGKTTLLSMMTGLLTPSGGTAVVCGYDIQYELEKVQGLIGYCPQFNILWDELTAREHLALFAKLRNTPVENREEMISEKLKLVNLLQAGDKLTSTFSGGMKRRLSVIISSVGNPSVIFMDEPTTGMDPITRREVWKLIQKLKKDRVIILTTHSMEEAELLSDRVAVMADGYIKCSGTCLFLKNSYGEGFKVEIIHENPQDLWKILEKQIPSAKLGDISGNSLFVSIPKTEPEDAVRFFSVIERLKIQEWGLSNSSLEEVFMKVTGKLENLFD
jgi:ABC-type multidrug transport system ATPase subunit